MRTKVHAPLAVGRPSRDVGAPREDGGRDQAAGCEDCQAGDEDGGFGEERHEGEGGAGQGGGAALTPTGARRHLELTQAEYRLADYNCGNEY